MRNSWFSSAFWNAVMLAAAFAGQARAQAVVEDPGYCAQYYPNSNCQNYGPGNPLYPGSWVPAGPAGTYPSLRRNYQTVGVYNFAVAPASLPVRDIAIGDPNASSSRDLMRWNVSVFEGGRGQIWTLGIDEDKADDAPLGQSLAQDGLPTCVLLMDKPTFERFEPSTASV